MKSVMVLERGLSGKEYALLSQKTQVRFSEPTAAYNHQYLHLQVTQCPLRTSMSTRQWCTHIHASKTHNTTKYINLKNTFKISVMTKLHVDLRIDAAMNLYLSPKPTCLWGFIYCMLHILNLLGVQIREIVQIFTWSVWLMNNLALLLLQSEHKSHILYYFIYPFESFG